LLNSLIDVRSITQGFFSAENYALVAPADHVTNSPTLPTSWHLQTSNWVARFHIKSVVSSWLALLDLIRQWRRCIFTVGIDYNGRHISDTRTMRWKTYYAHPLSGHTLFIDTLYAMGQTVVRPLQPFAAAKICGRT